MERTAHASYKYCYLIWEQILDLENYSEPLSRNARSIGPIVLPLRKRPLERWTDSHNHLWASIKIPATAGRTPAPQPYATTGGKHTLIFEINHHAGKAVRFSGQQTREVTLLVRGAQCRWPAPVGGDATEVSQSNPNVSSWACVRALAGQLGVLQETSACCRS